MRITSHNTGLTLNLSKKNLFENYASPQSLYLSISLFHFRIDKHHFQRRKEFISIITSKVTTEFIFISFSYFYAYLIPTLQQGQFFISSLMPILRSGYICFIINSKLAFLCFHNQSQLRHIRFNQQVIQRARTKYIDIQGPSIRFFTNFSFAATGNTN